MVPSVSGDPLAASIAGLLARLGALKPEDRSLVERLLRIDEAVGLQEVPPDLRAKVARWCGGGTDAASEAWRKAEEQTVVSVHSIWTYETANFNPLRACRPTPSTLNGLQGGPDAIAESCRGVDKCDFCDASRLTCVEPFGRVEGKFSLTCGNVFKSAGLHGLVIWSRHEPHKLTAEETVDGFETADAWFENAERWWRGREAFAQAHPVMFWNCFGSSGASQVHPHMQLQLFRGPVAQGACARAQSVLYRRAMARLGPGPGPAEALPTGHAADAPDPAADAPDLAAEDPASSGGAYAYDLCEDIARAHALLGLAAESGTQATCWASLTPAVQGGELCVLGPCEAGGSGRPTLAAVAPAVAGALRALRRCGAEGISVVGFLVPVGGDGDNEAWFVRCMNRGLACSPTTDAASAELAGLATVSSDPYHMHAALKHELAATMPQEGHD